MVFAVNPVQDSARNFTAFLDLAKTLNGTNATGAATTPSGSASPSPSPTNNGAGALGVNLALGVGSVFAVFALAL